MKFNLTSEEIDVLREEGIQYDLGREYYGFSGDDVLDAAFKTEGFLSDELSYTEENQRRIGRLAAIVDKLQKQLEEDFMNINYSILNYYYTNLKNGKQVKQEELLPGGSVFWDQDGDYWESVFDGLISSKMLQGVKSIEKTEDVTRLEITPLGIEFLLTKNEDLLKFW